MKKLTTLLTIAIILMVAIIMTQTVPPKEKHKEAMMEAIKEFVDSEASERGFGDNVLTKLGKNVAVKTAQAALNSKLKEHNYYVLNTTYVKYKGKEQLLSLGLFGMVFTFDKDMLHEKLEEALHSKEEAASEKDAAKQSARELKEAEKEQKKRAKQLEKEQKKIVKEARKEQKRREKEARKEQKRREKEARKLQKL